MPDHEHTDDVGDEGEGDCEHIDHGEAGKDDNLDDYHDDGHESGLIMIMMMVMMIMMIMMMVFCLPMKCFTKRQVRRLHLAG